MSPNRGVIKSQTKCSISQNNDQGGGPIPGRPSTQLAQQRNTVSIFCQIIVGLYLMLVTYREDTHTSFADKE